MKARITYWISYSYLTGSLSVKNVTNCSKDKLMTGTLITPARGHWSVSVLYRPVVLHLTGSNEWRNGLSTSQYHLISHNVVRCLSSLGHQAVGEKFIRPFQYKHPIIRSQIMEMWRVCNHEISSSRFTVLTKRLFQLKQEPYRPKFRLTTKLQFWHSAKTLPQLY